MGRNIRPLFNFDPPAADAEIHEASVQFVRKISGFTKPSKANAAAFDEAVDGVARVTHALRASLVPDAPPRSREVVAARARARAAARFASR